MLRNRTVKTTAYNHWLSGRLPPAMQESDKDHLLAGLRQGNQESRNKIIEGHMRLAADIVGRYHTVSPNANTEEMLSAAFMGVVHATDLARNLPHDNLTAYITTHIHNYVQRRGIDPYVSDNLRLQQDLTVQDSRAHEIQEELDVVAYDDVDAIIIDMLSRGHKQVVIAEHLNIKQPSVANRIRNIRARLVERNNVVE